MGRRGGRGHAFTRHHFPRLTRADHRRPRLMARVPRSRPAWCAGLSQRSARPDCHRRSRGGPIAVHRHTPRTAARHPSDWSHFHLRGGCLLHQRKRPDHRHLGHRRRRRTMSAAYRGEGERRCPKPLRPNRKWPKATAAWKGRHPRICSFGSDRRRRSRRGRHVGRLADRGTACVAHGGGSARVAVVAQPIKFRGRKRPNPWQRSPEIGGSRRKHRGFPGQVASPGRSRRAPSSSTPVCLPPA